MLVSVSSIASAQIFCANSKPTEFEHEVPFPHKSIKPHKPVSTSVTYNDVSTVLTVNFPSNAEGGTVEVYRDGVKVSAMTAGGGTMFSCTLQDYGTGNYDIIVSDKKTVIYTKNVIIN